MTEQAEIRRLQSTLAIAGGAVIVFCVWSFAKIALFLTFLDEDALQWLLGINDSSLITVICVAAVILVIIDFILRVFVGLSARAEGHGKKKGRFYLIVAFLAAIANALTLVAIVLSTSFSSSVFGMIVSIAVEATALAALVIVICCSIRLRRMDKTTG